jgi:antitoxin (DNA-binding transcriptional repressor) of toxin-antitoxin stability system
MNAATLPISVTATEFTRGISDYLSQVQYRGQVIDISRGKKVIARVIPGDAPYSISATQAQRVLDNLPALDAEEREAFAADLTQIRRDFNAMPARAAGDPWADV